MQSSILQAFVMHHRLRPRKHKFVYPVFMLRLDIAELCAPSSPLSSAMLGINRWRPLSIYFKDYGPRDGTNLEVWIRGLLRSQNVGDKPIDDIERIELLSFPRVFGYAFNPISLWYCYDGDSELKVIVAEVNNTFGEHHFYLLKPTDGEAITSKTRLICEKKMHVSPFCEIKGHYQFKFTETSKKSVAHIDYHDDDGLLLQTAIAGKRHAFNIAALLKCLCKQPFLTLGVFARIHWHALLLWLKRVPFYRQSHITSKQISTNIPIEQERLK
ncbi:DUF1365 domain-containing protein [Undibacterium sp. Ji22W]|uniref:DUF1365 domain-containing protein n=1 Tax=Undibacterium sp. Ji22W TaxID=3413038 RepID=UPI003BF0404F